MKPLIVYESHWSDGQIACNLGIAGVTFGTIYVDLDGWEALREIGRKTTAALVFTKEEWAHYDQAQPER